MEISDHRFNKNVTYLDHSETNGKRWDLKTVLKKERKYMDIKEMNRIIIHTHLSMRHGSGILIRSKCFPCTCLSISKLLIKERAKISVHHTKKISRSMSYQHSTNAPRIKGAKLAKIILTLERAMDTVTKSLNSRCPSECLGADCTVLVYPVVSFSSLQMTIVLS